MMVDNNMPTVRWNVESRGVITGIQQAVFRTYYPQSPSIVAIYIVAAATTEYSSSPILATVYR